MLAQRADDILRKLVTFVDISADLADKALFAFCFRLRFYVLLIIGIAHGFPIAHDAGFGNAADEHTMGTQVYILLHLQGHKCVDILIQEYQSISGAVDFLACELIHGPSGLEAKLLEYGEGRVHGQAVYVQNSGLLDDMMGIVGFIDIDCHAVGVVSQLGYGVYNQAVVLLPVMGGYHIESVSDTEEGGHIIFICQGIIFCDIFLAKLVGHGVDLTAVFCLYCGPDVGGVFQPGDVAAF